MTRIPVDMAAEELAAIREQREADDALRAGLNRELERSRQLQLELSEKDEQIERLKNRNHDLELVNQTLRRRVESLEKDRSCP